jgi:hypothetical protein
MHLKGMYARADPRVFKGQLAHTATVFGLSSSLIRNFEAVLVARSSEEGLSRLIV